MAASSLQVLPPLKATLINEMLGVAISGTIYLTAAYFSSLISSRDN